MMMIIYSDIDGMKWINENLEKINKQPGRLYSLQVSMGGCSYDRDATCSIGELMTRADKLMYERKLKRKKIPAEYGIRHRADLTG